MLLKLHDNDQQRHLHGQPGTNPKKQCYLLTLSSNLQVCCPSELPSDDMLHLVRCKHSRSFILHACIHFALNKAYADILAESLTW